LWWFIGILWIFVVIYWDLLGFFMVVYEIWEIPCRWAFSSMGKSPIIADTLSFQILICDPDSLTMAFSKALFVHNMLMGE
jgi:hypothetical protein